MLKQSIQEYFWFGTCVRYLQDAQADWAIHPTEQGVWRVLSNLEEFFEYLDRLGLRVTRGVAARANLVALLEELRKSPSGARLSAEQADCLRDGVNKLRDTLEAELQGSDAYIVTPKRIDTVALLGNVTSLFASGVFDKLPAIVKYDLGEAGRCLAFERGTAAAFHLLRATEGVLREFYTRLVKRDRSDLMWGPMVQSMRSRKIGRKHKILLDHLDNIRGSFRNPTAHPEKMYEIDEAQDLWGVCADAINRMAREL